MKHLKGKPSIIDSKDWLQICALCVGSIPGLTCGMLFTWPSPSIPILASEDGGYNFSLDDCAYLGTIPTIASAIVCICCANFIDRLGRKYVILFFVIPHSLALLLIAFSKHIYLFYLSRVLSGICDGLLFVVMPSYFGEITTPKVRGTFGIIFPISLYLGQFLINVCGYYLDIRTTALIFLTFPIVFFFTFIFMPESPYFYLMKGKKPEALNSLRRLRQTDDVREEMLKLENDVKRQMSETGSWRELLGIDSNRRALSTAIFLRFSQQLSGMACFVVYTPFIFSISASTISPGVSSIIFTSTFLVFTFIASFIVERMGRRISMLSTLLSCAIVLGIEAIFFYLSSTYPESEQIKNLNWVPLAGMIMYGVSFSFGLSIVPTLMMGELFSASIKGKGLCAANTLFQILVSLITRVFFVLQDNFGMYLPFAIFSICSFCNFAIGYFVMPETKGKTLEEIQQSFKRNKSVVDTNSC